MIKEHPILFTGIMVGAILKGFKTQTRRVVKYKIDSTTYDLFYWQPEDHNDKTHAEIGLYGWCKSGLKYYGKSPFGEVGDLLWVRETWAYVDNSEFNVSSYYEYKADKPNDKYPGDWPNDLVPCEVPLKWQSPLFMPRAASRIVLRIESIKLEKLNSISDEDCEKEGIVWMNNGCCEECYQWTFDKKYWFDYCKDCYEFLWDKINGKKYPWKSNPWVWVITFTKIEP